MEPLAGATEPLSSVIWPSRIVWMEIDAPLALSVYLKAFPFTLRRSTVVVRPSLFCLHTYWLSPLWYLTVAIPPVGISNIFLHNPYDTSCVKTLVRNGEGLCKTF